MKIMKEKTDWLFEEKRIWTYRVFHNVSGDMTIEVILTSSVKKSDPYGSVLAYCSKEEFEKLTVNEINKAFAELKKRLVVDGIEVFRIAHRVGIFDDE